MSWNKSNNYSGGLIYCTAYSGGGISQVIGNAGATWTPGSFYSQNLITNSFSYDDSVVQTELSLHWNTGSMSVLRLGTLTYNSSATITSSDWQSGSSTGVRLTTSVYDYLLGEHNEYTRPNALGQLYFAVSKYTVGSYGYNLQNPNSYAPMIMIIALDLSINGSTATLNINLRPFTGTYGAYGPQYSYNTKYSGTKSVQFVIEGYTLDNDTSAARFTFTETWEDPSFFNAAKVSVTFSGGSITSGSTVNLTVNNPMRLNYTISGTNNINGSGHSVLGVSGSHTATSASDPASQTYSLTISSRNDWLALATGFNGWAASYPVYAIVTYSTSSSTSGWNANTYIVSSTGTSNQLTVRTNNNYVGDLTPATFTHTTPGATGLVLPSAYIDGKTTLTFNLNGIKVPYWYGFSGNFYIDAIFHNAAGTYTQTTTLFNVSYDTLYSNYSTVVNNELVLSNIPTVTVTLNLRMPYSDTSGQFSMELVYRYINNSEAYQRGMVTKINSNIFYTYRDPEITAFDGNRYSSGTVQSYVLDEIEGEIAGIYAVFNCAPLDNRNILEVHSISVKETATGASVYWTSDISSGVRLYKPESAYLLDIDKSYLVTLTLTDMLSTTVTSTITIPAGSCFLDFHAGGTGMAIGKASEGSGLEVNFDSYFLQDVNFGTANFPIDVDFTNANVTGLSTGSMDIGNGDTLTIEQGGTLDVQGDVKGLRQSFVVPYTVSSGQNFLLKFTQFSDYFYYFELDGKAPFTKVTSSGMSGTYNYSLTLPSDLISLPSDSSVYFVNVTVDSLQTGGITNNVLFPSYATASRNGTYVLVFTVGMTSNITLSGNPTFPSSIVFNVHFSGLIPVLVL